MKSIVRLRTAATAIAGFLCLAGCEPQHGKIVAEVNNEAITDEEYNPRVQSVTAIPENMNLDAGGMTIVNMIRDRLTDQLARKYHAVPSDETVSAAADYQARMDPMTSAGLAAGKLSRDDLKRQKKFELEAFGVGTNGDKPSEQDIDKAFEEYKDKPDLRLKTSYTVKALQVPNEAIGTRIVAELKQTGDFKGAAVKFLGVPPLAAVNAGKDQTLTVDQCPPELRDALDKLKPNEITPAPVAIKLPNPQQPLNTPSVYVVAQLKSKEPGRTLSKSEVRFLLEPVVLQKTHPDWKEHYRRELADFTQKSHNLRISIQKYESLVDTYVRPLATSESTGHPTTMPEATRPGTLQ